MTYANTAILAFLVHLIVHFDAIRNSHYRNETASGKAYRALVCTVLLFYVSDALWGILYEARLIPALYADTVLYFSSMAASLHASPVRRHLPGPGLFRVCAGCKPFPAGHVLV